MSRATALKSLRLSFFYVVIFILVGTATRAQFPSSADTDAMIQLDLQPNIPLDALLTYTSRQIGINYSYSTEIGNRRVNIQAPVKVPVRALPLLVSSVLRANGLAIVDGDLPGWKRIVPSNDMYALAPLDLADNVLQRDGVGAPVTQIFLLKRYAPATIVNLVKHLFPGGQTTVAPNTEVSISAGLGTRMLEMSDANILILTDYAGNIKKIAEFIDLVDRAGETVFEFYVVKHQKSANVTDQARKVLDSRNGSLSGNIPPAPGNDGNGSPTPQTSIGSVGGGPVRFFDDENANRVVVVGRRDLVEEALKLLERFDVSLDIREKIFRPRNLSASQLQTIIEGFLPDYDDARVYRGTVDEGANLFVVRASTEIIAKIDEIIEQFDKAPTMAESPLSIIKLQNAKAEEVLTTLLALQDAYGFNAGFGNALTGGSQFFGGAFGATIPGFQGGYNPFGLSGYGQSGFGLGGMGAGGFTQGGFGNQAFQTQQLPLQPGQPTTTGATSTTGTGTTSGGSQSNRNSQRGQQGGLGGFGGSATLPGGVRVTADIATNSLILVGPANVKPIYERLIEQLDQRRPQVLIEAKFISLTANDNFNFGVEFSAGDRTGAKRAFKFTSFGLSQVNPTTGALTIVPGQGANTTVVNPDIADMVLRALVTHTRAKVLSAPKILVNDNQEGKLESKTSIPFQSVNASNTVATTSLGGSQEAGTTIFVTPHINENDNLQLEFDIEFSTFTGTGTETLPPSRQIEKVSSSVTVPDGQTVIVGGLKRTADNQDYAGVPWLEMVPLLRDLLGRTGETKNQTSFFVFIRPLILRDSQFGDLQYLSDRQAGLMGIPSEYPSSSPVLMNACPTPASSISYQHP
jgi:general secretion pathway protein D